MSTKKPQQNRVIDSAMALIMAGVLFLIALIVFSLMNWVLGI